MSSLARVGWRTSDRRTHRKKKRTVNLARCPFEAARVAHARRGSGAGASGARVLIDASNTSRKNGGRAMSVRCVVRARPHAPRGRFNLILPRLSSKCRLSSPEEPKAARVSRK